MLSEYFMEQTTCHRITKRTERSLRHWNKIRRDTPSTSVKETGVNEKKKNPRPPNLRRPAVGSSRKLQHLTTTQSSAPPAKCQCHKNPTLSRKLSEGRKKRRAHGEVSEVIMTSSYKETRTYEYMTTSHPHPEKKKTPATEAPSQILANTNSTAMKETRHLWPRDTKMTTMMVMMMHSAFIVKNDRQEGGW